MKLVPVDGVLAAVHKAAQVSPDGADALVRLALFETVSDLSETHRGELEPLMLANMEKRLAGARGRLLRTSVGKALGGDDELDLEQAQHLAVLDEWVSKSLSGALLSLFNRQHPRDPDTGRFVEQAGVRSGSPENPAADRENSSKHGAVQQSERWVKGGLTNEDTPFTVFFRQQDEKGRAGDTLRRLDNVTHNTLMERLDAVPGAQVVGLSVERNNLDYSGQKGNTRGAVDLMRTFAGADELTARRLARALPLDDEGKVKGQSLNAERFYGASNGTDRKGYRQLAMTGEALRRVSRPGTPQHSVGAMAQLVGELGPEAEKILGPGIRRTAYRYRGTERRPDRELVTQVRDAAALSEAIAQNKAEAPAATARGNTYSQAMVSVSEQAGGSDDQKFLRAVGDTAVGYLLGAGGGASHLPSRKLTELSLESGEVPPSEGVLIDAHGRVHSQAVGYNGDHYLPFDLKNLNALFGGQYVRTRAAGGPSTEDIYTGLLTGARQIQVVSNSGVFTLEFDPDLRGGRRYSDKAKRMVQRYGELLDAVASGQLYEQDLTPEKQAELRRQAAQASGGDEKLYRELLNTSLGRARMMGSLQDEDADQLEEQAEEYARNQIQAEVRRHGRLSRAQLADRMDHYKREAMAQGGGAEVRRLKLDGPGYERALKALQQEFPYYIRAAEFETLPDWLQARGMSSRGTRYHYAPDRGHVKPGQTNPYLPGHTEASESLARRRANPAARMYNRRPKEEPETTAAAGGAEGRPAVAAPAAAGTTAAAQPTVTDVRAAMLKPNSDYQRGVHQAVVDSVGIWAHIEPNRPGPSPRKGENFESDVAQMSPDNFTAWKWGELEQEHGARTAEAFTNWLVNAPEAQQHKVLQSIDGALDAMGDYPQLERRGYTEQSVDDAYRSLKNMLSLLHPFTKPEGGGEPDLLAAPSMDDPRPLQLAEFPVGRDAAFYEQAAARAAIEDPSFAEAAEAIADEDDEDIALRVTKDLTAAENVGEDRAAVLQARAIATQRAWSLKKAREVTAMLAEMGGGAGPKAPPDDQVGKSSPRPRRVLVFHQVAGTSVAKSRRLPHRHRVSS